jgi:hypothetical protein
MRALLVAMTQAGGHSIGRTLSSGEHPSATRPYVIAFQRRLEFCNSTSTTTADCHPRPTVIIHNRGDGFPAIDLDALRVRNHRV